MDEETSIDWASLTINLRPTDFGLQLVVSASIIKLPRSGYLIVEDMATFSLKRADTSKPILELPMSYLRRYLNVVQEHTTIKFVANIDQMLVKRVEKLRKGQDLEASLKTETIYMEVDRDSRELGKLGWLYLGPQRVKDFRLITTREWIDKVLVPAGYGRKLILEIPFGFPEFPSSLPDQTVMSSFRDHLLRAIKELMGGYESYMNCRNDEAVNKVRESLDSFRKFLKDNKILLLRELLENTSTCSHQISEEIFASIICIVDSLYNISSKGPHAVTRGGQIFDFRPNSEDSEALICGLLGVLIFLSKKFERRLQIH